MNNSNLPVVTIVTPVLNGARFLEKTIVSVITQDYPNIEYIIMDGGSTDGTIDIIKKYESKIAYWESTPDRGQSHAINKGWQRGKGEILAWLNADDRYAHNAVFSEVVAYLQEHQNDMMVYGQTELEDETGKARGIRMRKIAFDLVRLMHPAYSKGVSQPSAFVRRHATEAVGWLDENLHYKMDADLWFRIAARFSVGYVPKIWARVILHSTMKSISPQAHMEVLTLYRKFYSLPDLPANVLALRPLVLSHSHVRHSHGNLMLGKNWAARIDILKALFTYPFIIKTHSRLIFSSVLGSRIWTLALSIKSKFK